MTEPDADLMAPEAAALDPIAASPLNRLAHPAAYAPGRGGEAASPAPVPARLYVVLDVHGRPIKGPYVNEAEAEYWAYIKGCPSPCTLGFLDVQITPDPRPPISR